MAALFAILAINPAYAFGEDANLGEIFVNAPGVKDETAASSTILVKKNTAAHEDISTMVSRSPGVRVKKTGSIDDDAVISIRGAPALQTQLYLNHVPLVGADGSLPDLDAVPLQLVRSVDIYRGSVPVSLADAAGGGAIVINTSLPSKDDFFAKLSGGSFSSFSFDAGAAGVVDDVSIGGAYSASHSDGDFSYLNKNGTPNNTSDDRWMTRTNNDFTRQSGVIVAGEKSKWNALGLFYYKEKGVPGRGSVVADHTRYEVIRQVVGPSFSFGDFLAEGFADYSRRKFTDEYGELGLPRIVKQDALRGGASFHYKPVFNFNIGTGEKCPSALLSANSQSSRTTQVRSGCSFADASHLDIFDQSPKPASDDFNMIDVYASDVEDFLWMNQGDDHKSRHDITLGAEDVMSFLDDRIVIAAGGRASFVKSGKWSKLLSGKFGIKFEPLRNLFVRANVSRGYRLPTFFELYGDSGTAVGNPALSAETSLNWDAGLEFKSGVFSASLSYFEQRLDDLIQFVQSSAYSIKAMNISRAMIRGAEVSLSARINKMLQADAGYTFSLAKEASGPYEGRRLPGRPKHLAYASATLSVPVGRGFFVDGNGTVYFLADNYLDRQNLLNVESRFNADLTVALKKGEKWRAAFSCKNVSDQQIEDVWGYPLPGRSYWLEFELKASLKKRS